MIEKINKKYWIAFIIIILVGSIIIFIYNNFYNINNIPNGEHIESILSPNEHYKITSYIIKGDSLSKDAIRVELENTQTQKKKNIYWNYPQSDVTIKWLDDSTIQINDIKLNIYKDKYDWRL